MRSRAPRVQSSTAARLTRPVHVTHELLFEYLTTVVARFPHPGRLYLVGETSQLFAGFRDWTEMVEVAGSVEPEFAEEHSGLMQAVADELGIEVFEESPADVIPLPAGYEERAIPIESPTGALQLFHFDPYSVAYRFIARGDEPDYHLVLVYLENGWLEMEEMDSRLEALLPQFTNETIQQDPAEFRRRYKGLTQMAKAVAPRAIHRHTEA